MWHVWIDTGGTFTDCIALDPAGAIHRAKVLSTSALRARIRSRHDNRRFVISTTWGAPPGFARTLRFGVLGRPGPGAAVTGFDPGSRELRVGSPVDAAPGDAFELRSPEEAPILAARLATATPCDVPLPPIAMRLATTRGTNALLERKGAPGGLAFFVTRGFADLLLIGDQQRPDIFALDIRRPAPLYTHCVEVAERLDPRGRVIELPDLAGVERRAASLVARGVRTAAVALLHAWANPAHEHAVAAVLRGAGFHHVSCSADLSPTIKILSRAQTAVVNAYLAPAIDGYLARVASAFQPMPASAVAPVSPLMSRGSNRERGPVADATPSRLHVMTSAGGLVPDRSFRPKDSLLSGPAGGVVGAAAAARACGLKKIITFDMGGTSTDAARCDLDAGFEYLFEHEVGAGAAGGGGGGRIAAPALAIESVAAGGGSICAADAAGLRVGPESAGADPGPACYGAGGPFTITDANLLLGRVDATRFGVPLDPDAARARLAGIARDLTAATGRSLSDHDLLTGFLEIAAERMADAIRRVSVRRGFDPAEHALVAFGGAGPQHACAVAQKLGIATILVPPDPGLLSAAGLGAAAVERFAQRQVLRPLAAAEPLLPALVADLAAQAAAALRDEGLADAGTGLRAMVHLRLAGQESSVAIDWHDGLEPAAAFRARYASIYGYVPDGRAIEVESVRVAVRAVPPQTPGLRLGEDPGGDMRPTCGGVARRLGDPTSQRCADLSGIAPPPGSSPSLRPGVKSETVTVHDRDTLAPDRALGGPTLVVDLHSTTVVEPGWDATPHPAGALILRRDPVHSAPGAPRATAVDTELFTGRLTDIAREMGDLLQRTALSVNVKERLDFSCALLDPGGSLVVNAPHIPVHLGALGVCVRELQRAIAMDPGDVVVTNHPAFGGSHLPDVTVVTPIHAQGGALLGYAASRAHHAEIGGTRPGSMPPGARTLAEEGAVIPPMHLVRRGIPDWHGITRALTTGPYPTRALGDNLADLRAAVAANHRGVQELARMASHTGPRAVLGAMDTLQALAQRRAHEALARLGDRDLEATEHLDDGSPLHVRIRVRAGGADVDFSGTAAVHPGNLNATPAIVRSVLTYVMRLLVNQPLPLNEGLLRPLTVHLPECMLAPLFPADPTLCPAVACGNTETSQRLTGLMLKALGLCAGGQGTMNNVLFGDGHFGYYETVCGGAGAGPGFHGASAVHTHMTNTRITDPEVLELRYPVRLERFAIRPNSGGAGRFRGGDGAARHLLFLSPVQLSILSQNRVRGPYALDGAEPGQPGRQYILRAAGAVEPLAAADARDLLPGDRLILETPGGGGCGVGHPADVAP